MDKPEPDARPLPVEIDILAHMRQTEVAEFEQRVQAMLKETAGMSKLTTLAYAKEKETERWQNYLDLMKLLYGNAFTPPVYVQNKFQTEMEMMEERLSTARKDKDIPAEYIHLFE